MQISKETQQSGSIGLKLAVLGFFGLILGAFFYLIVRGHFGLGQVDFIHATMAPWTWNGLAWGSAPSLLHGFAFTCLAIAFGQSRTSAFLSWLILGSAWEVSQRFFPALGTFDSVDIAANGLGVLFAYVISEFSFGGNRLNVAKRAIRGPIYVLGLLSCMATSPHQANRGPIGAPFTYEPVFMTYEDLRKSFAVEAPRPIAKAGKIMVLGTTIFVSETNLGIHVIDNTDPTNPKPVHFLSLPGNIDLASKDGVLFADSFVDLVAIQIDGDKPIEVARINDTFPWNAYQAIDDFSIRFDPASVDPKSGVIVGAKQRDIVTKTMEKPNGK